MRRLALRGISVVLCAAFFSSEIAWAEPSVQAQAAPFAQLASNPASFRPPLDFCEVKEIHKGTGEVFIIHIQDAHSNLSGQQNLALALDEIMKKYGVRLVLSEGGQGDCSLTPLKKIAPAKVWRTIAKNRLVQGKIAGEEYLNLVSDHPMKIIGIENLLLYARSVMRYGELAGQRERILEYLKKIRGSADKLKTNLYPQELLDYEKTFAGDEQRSEDRYKQLVRLCEKKGLELNGYPNLKKLAELTKDEEKIDFDAANLEQAALIEEIEKRGLSDDIKEGLKSLSKSRNQKNASYLFFRALLEAAREKGIEIRKYPVFEAYYLYLENFSQIDLDELLLEIEKAEDALYVQILSSSSDARTLRAIDRFTNLLLTAYSIQMCTKEFREFQTNEPDFGTVPFLAYLNRQLAEKGLLEEMVSYDPALEEGKTALLSFYDSVSQRDEAFIANAEKAIGDEKEKVAVLISGGYHTQNLKRLFKERGFSYAILTPVVTAATNQKHYEKRLLGPMDLLTKTVDAKQIRSAPEKNPSKLDEEIARAKKKSGVRGALIAALKADSAKEYQAEFDNLQKVFRFNEEELRSLLDEAAHDAGLAKDDDKVKVAWEELIRPSLGSRLATLKITKRGDATQKLDPKKAIPNELEIQRDIRLGWLFRDARGNLTVRDAREIAVEDYQEYVEKMRVDALNALRARLRGAENVPQSTLRFSDVVDGVMKGVLYLDPSGRPQFVDRGTYELWLKEIRGGRLATRRQFIKTASTAVLTGLAAPGAVFADRVRYSISDLDGAYATFIELLRKPEVRIELKLSAVEAFRETNPVLFNQVIRRFVDRRGDGVYDIWRSLVRSAWDLASNELPETPGWIRVTDLPQPSEAVSFLAEVAKLDPTHFQSLLEEILPSGFTEKAASMAVPEGIGENWQAVRRLVDQTNPNKQMREALKKLEVAGILTDRNKAVLKLVIAVSRLRENSNDPWALSQAAKSLTELGVQNVKMVQVVLPVLMDFLEGRDIRENSVRALVRVAVYSAISSCGNPVAYPLASVLLSTPAGKATEDFVVQLLLDAAQGSQEVYLGAIEDVRESWDESVRKTREDIRALEQKIAQLKSRWDARRARVRRNLSPLLQIVGGRLATQAPTATELFNAYQTTVKRTEKTPDYFERLLNAYRQTALKGLSIDAAIQIEFAPKARIGIASHRNLMKKALNALALPNIRSEEDLVSALKTGINSEENQGWAEKDAIDRYLQITKDLVDLYPQDPRLFRPLLEQSLNSVMAQMDAMVDSNEDTAENLLEVIKQVAPIYTTEPEVFRPILNQALERVTALINFRFGISFNSDEDGNKALPKEGMECWVCSNITKMVLSRLGEVRRVESDEARGLIENVCKRAQAIQSELERFLDEQKKTQKEEGEGRQVKIDELAQKINATILTIRGNGNRVLIASETPNGTRPLLTLQDALSSDAYKKAIQKADLKAYKDTDGHKGKGSEGAPGFRARKDFERLGGIVAAIVMLDPILREELCELFDGEREKIKPREGGLKRLGLIRGREALLSRVGARLASSKIERVVSAAEKSLDRQAANLVSDAELLSALQAMSIGVLVTQDPNLFVVRELSRRINAASDTDLVERLSGIVNQTSGMPQIMAAWALIHAQENPATTSFRQTSIADRYVDFSALAGKKITTSQGEWTLRVKYSAYPFECTVTAESSEPVGRQNWFLGRTPADATKQGKIVATDRTVGFVSFIYSLNDIPTTRLTPGQLGNVFSRMHLVASEVLESQKDSGVQNALLSAVASIFPENGQVILGPAFRSAPVDFTAKDLENIKSGNVSHPSVLPFINAGFQVAQAGPVYTELTRTAGARMAVKSRTFSPYERKRLIAALHLAHTIAYHLSHPNEILKTGENANAFAIPAKSKWPSIQLSANSFNQARKNLLEVDYDYYAALLPFELSANPIQVNSAVQTFNSLRGCVRKFAGARLAEKSLNERLMDELEKLSLGPTEILERLNQIKSMRDLEKLSKDPSNPLKDFAETMTAAYNVRLYDYRAQLSYLKNRFDLFRVRCPGGVDWAKLSKPEAPYLSMKASGLLEDVSKLIPREEFEQFEKGLQPPGLDRPERVFDPLGAMDRVIARLESQYFSIPDSRLNGVLISLYTDRNQLVLMGTSDADKIKSKTQPVVPDGLPPIGDFPKDAQREFLDDAVRVLATVSAHLRIAALEELQRALSGGSLGRGVKLVRPESPFRSLLQEWANTKLDMFFYLSPREIQVLQNRLTLLSLRLSDSKSVAWNEERGLPQVERTLESEFWKQLRKDATKLGIVRAEQEVEDLERNLKKDPLDTLDRLFGQIETMYHAEKRKPAGDKDEDRINDLSWFLTRGNTQRNDFIQTMISWGGARLALDTSDKMKLITEPKAAKMPVSAEQRLIRLADKVYDAWTDLKVSDRTKNLLKNDSIPKRLFYELTTRRNGAKTTAADFIAARSGAAARDLIFREDTSREFPDAVYKLAEELIAQFGRGASADPTGKFYTNDKHKALVDATLAYLKRRFDGSPSEAVPDQAITVTPAFTERWNTRILAQIALTETSPEKKAELKKSILDLQGQEALYPTSSDIRGEVPAIVLADTLGATFQGRTDDPVYDLAGHILEKYLATSKGEAVAFVENGKSRSRRVPPFAQMHELIRLGGQKWVTPQSKADVMAALDDVLAGSFFEASGKEDWLEPNKPFISQPRQSLGMTGSFGARLAINEEQEQGLVQNTANRFIQRNSAKSGIDQIGMFIRTGKVISDELDYAIQRGNGVRVALSSELISQREKEKIRALLDSADLTSVLLGLTDETRLNFPKNDITSITSLVKFANEINFREGTGLEIETTTSGSSVEVRVRNRPSSVIRLPSTLDLQQSQVDSRNSLGSWLARESLKGPSLKQCDVGITDLGVITHKAPNVLRGTLLRYIENLKDFGHTDVQISVFDDTKEDDPDAQANEAIVRELGKIAEQNGLPLIRYVGVKAKKAYKNAIAENLRLTGKDPDISKAQIEAAFRPSAAGNRNFAMAYLAGKKICLVDHDSSPGATVVRDALLLQKPGFTSPEQIFFDHDISKAMTRSALSPVVELSADMIGGMNRLLGKKPASLGELGVLARTHDGLNYRCEGILAQRNPKATVKIVKGIMTGDYDIASLWNVKTKRPGVIATLFLYGKGKVREMAERDLAGALSGELPNISAMVSPVQHPIFTEGGRSEGNQVAIDLTSPILPGDSTTLAHQDYMLAFNAEAFNPGEWLMATSSVAGSHHRSDGDARRELVFSAYRQCLTAGIYYPIQDSINSLFLNSSATTAERLKSIDFAPYRELLRKRFEMKELATQDDVNGLLTILADEYTKVDSNGILPAEHAEEYVAVLVATMKAAQELRDEFEANPSDRGKAKVLDQLLDDVRDIFGIDMEKAHFQFDANGSTGTELLDIVRPEVRGTPWVENLRQKAAETVGKEMGNIERSFRGWGDILSAMREIHGSEGGELTAGNAQSVGARMAEMNVIPSAQREGSSDLIPRPLRGLGMTGDLGARLANQRTMRLAQTWETQKIFNSLLQRKFRNVDESAKRSLQEMSLYLADAIDRLDNVYPFSMLSTAIGPIELAGDDGEQLQLLQELAVHFNEYYLKPKKFGVSGDVQLVSKVCGHYFGPNLIMDPDRVDSAREAVRLFLKDLKGVLDKKRSGARLAQVYAEDNPLSGPDGKAIDSFEDFLKALDLRAEDFKGCYVPSVKIPGKMTIKNRHALLKVKLPPSIGGETTLTFEEVVMRLRERDRFLKTIMQEEVAFYENLSLPGHLLASEGYRTRVTDNLFRASRKMTDFATYFFWDYLSNIESLCRNSIAAIRIKPSRITQEYPDHIALGSIVTYSDQTLRISEANYFFIVTEDVFQKIRQTLSKYSGLFFDAVDRMEDERVKEPTGSRCRFFSRNPSGVQIGVYKTDSAMDLRVVGRQSDGRWSKDQGEGFLIDVIENPFETFKSITAGARMAQADYKTKTLLGEQWNAVHEESMELLKLAVRLAFRQNPDLNVESDQAVRQAIKKLFERRDLDIDADAIRAVGLDPNVLTAPVFVVKPEMRKEQVVTSLLDDAKVFLSRLKAESERYSQAEEVLARYGEAFEDNKAIWVERLKAVARVELQKTPDADLENNEVIVRAINFAVDRFGLASGTNQMVVKTALFCDLQDLVDRFKQDKAVYSQYGDLVLRYGETIRPGAPFGGLKKIVEKEISLVDNPDDFNIRTYEPLKPFVEVVVDLYPETLRPMIRESLYCDLEVLVEALKARRLATDILGQLSLQSQQRRGARQAEIRRQETDRLMTELLKTELPAMAPALNERAKNAERGLRESRLGPLAVFREVFVPIQPASCKELAAHFNSAYLESGEDAQKAAENFLKDVRDALRRPVTRAIFEEMLSGAAKNDPEFYPEYLKDRLGSILSDLGEWKKYAAGKPVTEGARPQDPVTAYSSAVMDIDSFGMGEKQRFDPDQRKKLALHFAEAYLRAGELGIDAERHYGDRTHMSNILEPFTGRKLTDLEMAKWNIATESFLNDLSDALGARMAGAIEMNIAQGRDLVESALRQNQVVLMGDIHSATAEHLLFANYMQEAAKKGIRFRVALELTKEAELMINDPNVSLKEITDVLNANSQRTYGSAKSMHSLTLMFLLPIIRQYKLQVVCIQRAGGLNEVNDWMASQISEGRAGGAMLVMVGHTHVALSSIPARLKECVSIKMLSVVSRPSLNEYIKNFSYVIDIPDIPIDYNLINTDPALEVSKYSGIGARLAVIQVASGATQDLPIPQPVTGKEKPGTQPEAAFLRFGQSNVGILVRSGSDSIGYQLVLEVTDKRYPEGEPYYHHLYFSGTQPNRNTQERTTVVIDFGSSGAQPRIHIEENRYENIPLSVEGFDSGSSIRITLKGNEFGVENKTKQALNYEPFDLAAYEASQKAVAAIVVNGDILNQAEKYWTSGKREDENQLRESILAVQGVNELRVTLRALRELKDKLWKDVKPGVPDRTLNFLSRRIISKMSQGSVGARLATQAQQLEFQEYFANCRRSQADARAYFNDGRLFTGSVEQVAADGTVIVLGNWWRVVDGRHEKENKLIRLKFNVSILSSVQRPPLPTGKRSRPPVPGAARLAVPKIAPAPAPQRPSAVPVRPRPIAPAPKPAAQQVTPVDSAALLAALDQSRRVVEAAHQAKGEPDWTVYYEQDKIARGLIDALTDSQFDAVLRQGGMDAIISRLDRLQAVRNDMQTGNRWSVNYSDSIGAGEDYLAKRALDRGYLRTTQETRSRAATMMIYAKLSRTSKQIPAAGTRLAAISTARLSTAKKKLPSYRRSRALSIEELEGRRLMSGTNWKTALGAPDLVEMAAEQTVNQWVANQPAPRAEGESIQAPRRFGTWRFDTNNDHRVAPSDALKVVIRINLRGSGPVDPNDPSDGSNDVSGNEIISPEDVMLLYNYLNANVFEPDPLQKQAAIDAVMASEEAVEDPVTHLSTSHVGQPGWENTAFLYDLAVNAMASHAAGKQPEAEETLDKLAGLLQASPSGLANALDVRTGQATLEYYVTPGPMSVFALACAKANYPKYEATVKRIGEILLTMQKSDGGVTDGTRDSSNVVAEPHLDAYAVFLMLSQKNPDDARWAAAAAKSKNFFMTQMYDPVNATVARSVKNGVRENVFATDAYAWFMHGPMGDDLTADQIKALTNNMLQRSLVRIKLDMPDGSVRVLTLADFADYQEAQIQRARGSAHPIGFTEQTGIECAALKKNAVRMQAMGDLETASFYKAIASILENSILGALVDLASRGIMLAPYATAQNAPTGHGWNTMPFYIKDGNGNNVIQGGSLIGGYWAVLGFAGYNPFMDDAGFASDYAEIPLTSIAKQNAKAKVESIASGRYYSEPLPVLISQPGLGVFVKQPWPEPYVTSTEYATWAVPSGGASSFDLSLTGKLKITFASGMAGRRFMLRLLPSTETNLGAETGLSHTVYIVPIEGVLEIDVDPSIFGLTKEQLKQITQISVHSNQFAWGHAIGNPKGTYVNFQTMEGLAGARLAADASTQRLAANVETLAQKLVDLKNAQRVLVAIEQSRDQADYQKQLAAQIRCLKEIDNVLRLLPPLGEFNHDRYTTLAGQALCDYLIRISAGQVDIYPSYLAPYMKSTNYQFLAPFGLNESGDPRRIEAATKRLDMIAAYLEPAVNNQLSRVLVTDAQRAGGEDRHEKITEPLREALDQFLTSLEGRIRRVQAAGGRLAVTAEDARAIMNCSRALQELEQATGNLAGDVPMWWNEVRVALMSRVPAISRAENALRALWANRPGVAPYSTLEGYTEGLIQTLTDGLNQLSRDDRQVSAPRLASHNAFVSSLSTEAVTCLRDGFDTLWKQELRLQLSFTKRTQILDQAMKKAGLAPEQKTALAAIAVSYYGDNQALQQDLRKGWPTGNQYVRLHGLDNNYAVRQALTWFVRDMRTVLSFRANARFSEAGGTSSPLGARLALSEAQRQEIRAALDGIQMKLTIIRGQILGSDSQDYYHTRVQEALRLISTAETRLRDAGQALQSPRLNAEDLEKISTLLGQAYAPISDSQEGLCVILDDVQGPNILRFPYLQDQIVSAAEQIKRDLAQVSFRFRALMQQPEQPKESLPQEEPAPLLKIRRVEPWTEAQIVDAFKAIGSSPATIEYTNRGRAGRMLQAGRSFECKEGAISWIAESGGVAMIRLDEVNVYGIAKKPEAPEKAVEKEPDFRQMNLAQFWEAFASRPVTRKPFAAQNQCILDGRYEVTYLISRIFVTDSLDKRSEKGFDREEAPEVFDELFTKLSGARKVETLDQVVHFLDFYSTSMMMEDIDEARVEAIRGDPDLVNLLARMFVRARNRERIIPLLVGASGNGCLKFSDDRTAQFVSKDGKTNIGKPIDLSGFLDQARQDVRAKEKGAAGDLGELALVYKGVAMDSIAEMVRILQKAGRRGEKIIIQRVVPAGLADRPDALSAWIQAQKLTHRLIAKQADRAGITAKFQFLSMTEGRLDVLAEPSDDVSEFKTENVVRTGEMVQSFVDLATDGAAIFTEPMFADDGKTARLLPDGPVVTSAIVLLFADQADTARFLGRFTGVAPEPQDVDLLKKVPAGLRVEQIQAKHLALQALSKIMYNLIATYQMISKAVGAAA